MERESKKERGEEPEKFYILRYRLRDQPEVSKICINEYML